MSTTPCDVLKTIKDNSKEVCEDLTKAIIGNNFLGTITGKATGKICEATTNAIYNKFCVEKKHK